MSPQISTQKGTEIATNYEVGYIFTFVAVGPWRRIGR